MAREIDDKIKDLTVDENPAKSLEKKKIRRYGERRKRKREKLKRRGENRISKRIGIVISVLLFIASAILLASLIMLNMLSWKYIAIVTVILLILFLAVFLGQLFSKKKAIFGKIMGVLLSAVFLFGSYYIMKMNSTVENISSDNTVKVDSVVVVVKSDDPAEKIQDAISYDFGVQYTLKGEEIHAVVNQINEETDSQIQTTEYDSILDQVNALNEGEVQAIIYNNAYTQLIEEQIEDYSENVKVIYSHEIQSENLGVQVEPDTHEGDSFAVYISGIDVYGDINTTSRSDVNIIAVVNTESHQILLVTTPRDYYVPIPGVSGGERDKLTHAGIYGINASIDTLEELYDMNINYYVRVNFTSLVKMVDALGGISVYSDQAFQSSHNDMNVVKGYNEFNGEQALAFARERYNVDGGDFQRGKNQQEVIKGMLKKALSPAILSGANGILESVSGNVDTNMPTDKIRELVRNQLDSNASWNVKTMSASGTGDTRSCYSMPTSQVYVAWPNEESVSEISQAIKAVEKGEVLDGSETTSQ